ncbi:MAG: hypothetical protein P8129_19210 [Anaerolineae bacterium]
MLEQVALFRIHAWGAYLVDQGGVRLAGLLGAGSHRQGLVLDLDQVQRLAGDLGRVGGHHGHRVAQVADLVVAQHGPVVVDQAVSVAARHVGVGQHGAHAGQSLGLAGVDGQDAGVGIFGPQRGAVQHALEGVIVRELGRARHLVHGVGPRVRVANDVQGRHRLGLGRRQRLAGAGLVHGRLHGAQHAGIARAAAGVAGQGLFDLFLADLALAAVVDEPGPQGRGSHQQAGGAKAALHRAVLDEGLLQGMQLARLAPPGSQALDGQHLLALGPAGGPDAGPYGLAVQQDDARAAQAVAAADLGAGEAQIVAQHVGQLGVRADFDLVFRAVDG